MSEQRQERGILSREIVIDQTDPRMIEFRKSHREFEPGSYRRIVKLEITTYKPDPKGHKVKTTWGYYEGEPPRAYRE